jgi:hypothetical protein
MGLHRSKGGGFIVTSLLKKQGGKVGWLLLWLVGVPVPVLIILFLLRGCT